MIRLLIGSYVGVDRVTNRRLALPSNKGKRAEMGQTMSLLEEQNETISLNATVLRKHVYAVHCATPLTLLEIQLANVLLQNALRMGSVDSLKHQRMHRIYVADLVELLRPGSRNYKQIYNCVDRLLTKKIRWAITEDAKTKRWGGSAWLAGYDFEKDGFLYYSYSANLVDQLLNPAVYARLNFSIQHLITSRHTQSLYENCARYREWGQTKVWDLETFRELMGISDAASYEKFKELRRSVIAPAVKEINTKTELFVEPEYFRRGQQVVSVRFQVRENTSYEGPTMPAIRPVSEQLDTDALESRAETYERLTIFGIEHSRASSLIARFSDDHINRNLDLVAERLYRKPESVKRISGLAVNAVECDYSGKQPDAQKVLDFETRNERDNRRQEEEQQQAKKKLARFEHELLPKWRAEQWIGQVDKSEKQRQWDAFREYQTSQTPFIAKMFREDPTGNSTWVASLWRNWVKEHCLPECTDADREACAVDLKIDLERLRRVARETRSSEPLTDN